MTGWKTMDEWKASDGPPNGTVMLVLSPEGDRQLAKYRGETHCWYSDTTGDTLDWRPVAWAPVPEVPEELIQRNRTIDALREQLEAQEVAPLTLRQRA